MSVCECGSNERDSARRSSSTSMGMPMYEPRTARGDMGSASVGNECEDEGEILRTREKVERVIAGFGRQVTRDGHGETRRGNEGGKLRALAHCMRVNKIVETSCQNATWKDDESRKTSNFSAR